MSLFTPLPPPPNSQSVATGKDKDGKDLALRTDWTWQEWFSRLYAKLLTITVLPTLGSANQLLGVNNAGTDLEYKTLGSQSVAGTLPAVSGGTGFGSYAQGNILYANTTTTLAKLAKDTNATRYLSNTGTNNNPAWAQIDLTNGVTGILPTANGGTSFATYVVGDLLYANTTSTLAKLADVAVGSFLRSGGVSTAPGWSTTVWTNSATTGDLLYASAANTYSNLAGVATGQLLKSGGVGTAPSWGTFAATGDATGTYGATGLPLVLATVNANVGSFGSTTQVGTFTVNGKGLITAAANVSIAFPVTSVFGQTGAIANLSGDVTTSGSSATTLATVNSNVGTFGDSTHVAQITVNAKGLVTAVANVSTSAPFNPDFFEAALVY